MWLRREELRCSGESCSKSLRIRSIGAVRGAWDCSRRDDIDVAGRIRVSRWGDISIRDPLPGRSPSTDADRSASHCRLCSFRCASIRLSTSRGSLLDVEVGRSERVPTAETESPGARLRRDSRGPISLSRLNLELANASSASPSARFLSPTSGRGSPDGPRMFSSSPYRRGRPETDSDHCRRSIRLEALNDRSRPSTTGRKREGDEGDGTDCSRESLEVVLKRLRGAVGEVRYAW